jgi:hypothetical protein
MLTMTIQQGVTIGRERPAWARTALVAVNLGVLSFFLLNFSGHRMGFLPYRIDLDVYRIGSRVWLDGGTSTGRCRRPLRASGCRSATRRSPPSCSLRSR